MANYLISKSKPLLKLLTGQALMASSSMALQIIAGASWHKSDFGLWSSYWLWIQLAEAIVTAVIIFPLQSEKIDAKNYNPSQFLILILGILFGLLLPISGYIFSAGYNITVAIATLGYLVTVSNRKLCILNGYMIKNSRYEYSISILQFAVGLAIYFTQSNSSIIWLILGMGYLVIAAFQYEYRFNFNEVKVLGFKLIGKGIPQLLSSIVTWYAGNGLMLSAGAILGTTVLGNLRFAQTLLGIWNLVFQTLENYLPSLFLKNYLSNVKSLFIKGLATTSVSLALGLVIIQGSLILALNYLPSLGITAFIDKSSFELLIKVSGLYLLIALALPWRIAFRIMDRNWEQLAVSIVLASINLFLGNEIIQHFQVNGVLLLLAIQPVIYLSVSAFIIHFNPAPICKLYILSWAKPTLTE